MTVAAAPSRVAWGAPSVWGVVWLGLLAATMLLAIDRSLLPWASDYPATHIVPIAEWTSALMAFIKTHFTWITRLYTDVLSVPLDFAFGLLSKGFKLFGGGIVLPRFSWVGVTLVAAITGYALGGSRLAALAGACFLYIALFGQWESAMRTLALIAISVPLCILVGGAFGILAYRKPAFDKLVVTPALDLMQTMPTFAYLIPMLLLFGNSPVSAMIATAIFATPPMVRATTLALARVPAEIDDFGEMVGCTKRQKLWRVLMPSARPTLMIGVNQVIMLALNMVIIASMIGAGGLGYDVLLALRALKIGQGMEAGIAIVVLAIALDRLSQAAARQRPAAHVAGQSFWQRHPFLVMGAGALLVTTLLSVPLPALSAVPKAMTISTAPLWKAAVDWVNLHFFDYIEAFRVALLLYILNPLRAFCEGFPWLGALALLSFAGWRLGGARLALLACALTLFCVVTGLWEKTMATVYLCGIAVVVSGLIGIPLGLLSARSDRFQAFITPVLDTLQTLPSFCFIIPVVMLFRVGDVTALIATVLFAIVPAIRYTDLGLRQISPSLIEAATVSGCTPRQMFWRVQMPLALPEIMLGINQTVLLALSMIIICAMIGTRDLGQEVFIALAKADAGRGLVAGFAIAFIGIVADRLLRAWADRTERKLGLK
ncbi:MAG: ABC transporter permease subunit [Hyphomicrobiaceae bacterium]